MDYISILIGIFSLIQGWTNKKSDAERLASLTEICKKINQLDEVLLNSKRVHDAVERFQQKVGDQVESLSRTGTQTGDQIATFGSQYCLRLKEAIKDLPSPDDLRSLGKKEELESDHGLPAVVTGYVREIYRFYPMLIINISKTRELSELLYEVHDRADYASNKFKKRFLSTESELKESLSNADRIILNSANLISHLHGNVSSILSAGV